MLSAISIAVVIMAFGANSRNRQVAMKEIIPVNSIPLPDRPPAILSAQKDITSTAIYALRKEKNNACPSVMAALL